MNIYIKSFNRVYYLDRCITSIIENCSGNYQIVVMDDGTPRVYLDKLISKFSFISIKKSPFYDSKVEIIENNLKSNKLISNLEIPAKFWLETIFTDNDEVFMILEDDMWFVEKTDLNDIKELFSVNTLKLLKLSNNGNDKVNHGKRLMLTPKIDAIIPSLPLKNPKLFSSFINNKFKLRSIFNKITKTKNDSYLLKYYTIYAVAGAVYSKSYYQYLWKDFAGTVNEFVQLTRAVKYLSENNDSISYATFKNDIIKTSFSSSATNMFASVNLNVFRYNYILNEAWLNSSFNSMENYPKDFSDVTIENILDDSGFEDARVEEWHKWKSVFERRYKELGFKV